MLGHMMRAMLLSAMAAAALCWLFWMTVVAVDDPLVALIVLAIMGLTAVPILSGMTHPSARR